MRLCLVRITNHNRKCLSVASHLAWHFPLKNVFGSWQVVSHQVKKERHDKCVRLISNKMLINWMNWLRICVWSAWASNALVYCITFAVEFYAPQNSKTHCTTTTTRKNHKKSINESAFSLPHALNELKVTMFWTVNCFPRDPVTERAVARSVRKKTTRHQSVINRHNVDDCRAHGHPTRTTKCTAYSHRCVTYSDKSVVTLMNFFIAILLPNGRENNLADFSLKTPSSSWHELRLWMQTNILSDENDTWIQLCVCNYPECFAMKSH